MDIASLPLKRRCVITPALYQTAACNSHSCVPNSKGQLQARGRLSLAAQRSARCVFPHTSTSGSVRCFPCTQRSWLQGRRSGDFLVRAAPDPEKGSSALTDREDAEDEGHRGDDKTAAAVWITYGLYLLWLLVLPYAPGEPAWDIQPHTLEEVKDLSLNFFFLLPVSDALGLPSPFPAPILHPVAEGLFNFVNAWSLMFGPLLAADAEARRNRPALPLLGLWTGQMFLTNVFLLPYMALRLQSSTIPSNGNSNSNSSYTTATPDVSPLQLMSQTQLQQQQQQPSSPHSSFISAFLPIAPAIGTVGAAVALTSLLWSAFARPDVVAAASSSRFDFFLEYIFTDRLAYAFTFDIVLYALCQAVLIGNYLAVSQDAVGDGGRGSVRGSLRWLMFVPCFGLAAFLILLQQKKQPKISGKGGSEV